MASRCAKVQPHAPHSWSSLAPWAPPGMSSCPGRPAQMTEAQQAIERQAVDFAFEAYGDG